MMDDSLTPTLCLDGAAVRRIREEKKLTQLYVAKVVGVTTDTISRWENNRYPSVKRENVLRLAEALEVPLDNILQGVEDVIFPPADEEVVPRPRSRPRAVWGAALFVALSLALAGWLLLRNQAPPAPRIAAERVLAPYAAPGTVFPVRVRLQLDNSTKGLILREHFPPGWKIIEASPPASSIDNEEGTARWIVKPEETRQTISYLVRVDRRAPMGKAADFRGEIVASGSSPKVPVNVGGVSTVRVAPRLWADLNGDGIVDDAEMLQASETFDEMTGVHLDWKLLETIWDAGRYQWLPDQYGFAPTRPASTPPEAAGEGFSR